MQKKYFKFKVIKKAFTLVEVIIYLAVFSVFMSSVIGILLNSDRVNKDAQQQQILQNVKIYLNSHLQDSFNSTNRIDVPDTTNQGASTSLTLAQLQQGTSTVLNYYNYQLVSNQILFYYGSGAVPSPCTTVTCKAITISSYVKVTSMNFNLLKNLEGINVGVRVNINLQSNFFENYTTTLQTEYTYQ